VTSSKEELAVLADQAKLTARTVAKLEGEAEAKKGTINKSEVALNSAKSNTEYQVHLRAIDQAKTELGDIETGILESYEAQDARNEAKTTGDKRLGELQKDLAAAKKRVSDYGGELNRQISDLEGSRATCAETIGGEFLELYEKILAKSGDSAIARVNNSDAMCQGCYNKVRPNQLSQIRGRKELVTCWTCGRILYGDGGDN
jgi:predicted  nucleic acid-binding Zn-ribbon protein